MIQGISRTITGLTLSAVVGAIYSLPTVAQVRTAQTEPLPAVPTVPAGSTVVPIAPGSIEPSTPSLTPQAESSYTLGAGDAVRVDIFDTPELVLEPRYVVLVDGSLNLPWVGTVSVRGLTLSEAAERLKSRYGEYIKKPVITVSLLAARPLKVGVIGEVTRPGSYIISVLSADTTSLSLIQNNNSNNEGTGQWPTVSKAIQTAGGITQIADIRQVQVRRLQSNGQTETINVNLWKFLKEGDLSQDMLLRDGDTISIPVATDLNAAEATQVATSNFSPAAIRVNVVGEVVQPGAVTVRPNTTLNQAILAAGGPKNDRASLKRVELIRLNPNGTVSRRTIAVDLSRGLSEQNNPALRDNDTVVVRRNTFGGITDVLGVILSPLSGLRSILGL